MAADKSITGNSLTVGIEVLNSDIVADTVVAGISLCLDKNSMVKTMLQYAAASIGQ